MHQGAPLDMMLPSIDCLRIAARFRGLSWREISPWVGELTEYLGLKDSMRQLAFQLSGGQKQRLQLARALLAVPQLLKYKAIEHWTGGVQGIVLSKPEPPFSFTLFGQPLSAFHGREPTAPALSMPVLSLEPTDRAWLHARIAQRFDQMLAEGLVDEVRRLMALPGLHPDLPSMRCVGYRQVWEACAPPNTLLAPAWPNNPEQTVQHQRAQEARTARTIRETGIAATRQLAKRQLTWLRGMPERRVLACDQPALGERVLAEVRNIWG